MSYPQKPKTRGRDPVYDAAFKIAVATEYLTSTLGYERLGRKHGIPPATVQYFVKWLKANHPHGRDDQPVTSQPDGSHPGDRGQNIGSPEASSLRKELKEARLHIAALQTLISTASKELGVDISKNSGAKQSNK
jgi:transposase-like protein